MVDIPGDPDGRKLHVEYLSVRDSYDLAGKKRKDPDNPKGKRGGLVRREYRLVSRDYGISPRPPPPPRTDQQSGPSQSKQLFKRYQPARGQPTLERPKFLSIGET